MAYLPKANSTQHIFGNRVIRSIEAKSTYAGIPMFENDFKQFLAKSRTIDINGGLAIPKIVADRTASPGRVTSILEAI